MNESFDLNPAVSGLIIDHWRVLRALARLGDQQPESTRARVTAQVRFQLGRLDSTLSSLGVSLVTYEGRAFDGSLPPSAQNADDFPAEGSLFVAETLEPTLLAGGQILHSGKVNLAPEQ
ncbi:MAG: hypothetical protein PS018_15795 [bacterium]|nr:hypothetical protein [bacterium]